MESGGFDSRCGGLEIEKRPAARWKRDIVGLENAITGGLQNVVAQAQRLAGCFFALHQNRVANSIAKKRADVGRSDEQGVEELLIADF